MKHEVLPSEIYKVVKSLLEESRVLAVKKKKIRKHIA